MNDKASAHRVIHADLRRGHLSRHAARGLVRHLLAECEDCRAAAQRMWAPGGANRDRSTAGVHDYGAMFERLAEHLDDHQVALAEERAAVPAMRRELARHPVDRQRLLVTNSRRYRSWSLAESLLDDCCLQRPRDPALAQHLAELAIAMLEKMDEGRYGSRLLSDLIARGWGELAASLRARVELGSAEEAFATARRHLGAGTGDPVEKANLLWLEASLRVKQRRFDAASSLLQQVIAIASRYGDSHLWGKALISQAMCAGDQGLLDDEIRLLRQGLRRIDAHREPRLEAVVHHNLILSLVDARRYDEASRLLAHTRGLHERLDNRLDLIRFQWVEATVQRGLGNLETAERLYLDTRQAFLGEGLGFDAALVCLEVASLYAEAGRNADVRGLADLLVTFVRLGDLHAEAAKALAFFQQEAMRERVTVELVIEVAEFLERARLTPAIRFRERS